MSKFMRNIFALSLLVLTAGAFCLIPTAWTSKDGQKQIVAVAEENSDGILKVEQAGEELVNLFDVVSTKSVSLGTTSLYGHSTVYVIDSADKLAYVSFKVASGDSAYVNGVFSLTDDINLLGSLWTPIGTSANKFQGKFYGNGHTISNITINDASVDAGSSAVGLFGYISNASIMDVKLSGSMVYNTSKTYKGSLVGHSSGGEIINCYDQCATADGSGNSFVSVGYISNKTYIFLGGSYDGINKAFTTETDITKTFTYGSGASYTDGSNTVGRVGFYNLSDGKFCIENNDWYNSTQVRVLLSSSLATLEYTPKNNFYRAKIPCLRADASSTDIYPLKEGYKASIGTSTALKVGDSYIKTITYSESTTTLNFNYGYGKDRSGNFTFKYDQTFNSYFTEKPYTKIRAGYDFSGLYSNSAKTSQVIDGTVKTGYDYKNSYPIASETYYFKWTAQTGKSVYFQFVIDENEGGVFSGISQITGAVDPSSISYAGTTGSLSTADFSSRARLNVTALTSFDKEVDSSSFALSFKLQDGYTIKALTNNAAEVDTSNIANDKSYKADKTSGIYANFKNKTGIGDKYTVISSTNNDDYNLVTANGSYADGAYSITVDNIVGNSGVVYIVVARTEYEIDLTPIFAQTSKGYTHPYQWKIVDGKNLVDTISGVCRIGKPGDEITLDGQAGQTTTKTLDKYCLFVRKFESPNLQITTDTDGTATADAVIIAIKGVQQEGMTANPLNIKLTDDGKSNPRFDYNASTPAEDRLYRTWEIETGGFTGNGFIQMLIGKPQTRVTIQSLFVDQNGNAVEENGENNRINNLGTSINAGTKYLNSTVGYFVNMNDPDVITVVNNGYYMVDSLVIKSRDLSEKTFTLRYTPTFNVSSSKINGETSVWNDSHFFADIYTGTEYDETGVALINYQITVTYKIRSYNVNYEYYFNNVKQTNTAKLFSETTKLNGNNLNNFEGLAPSWTTSSSATSNPTILNIGLSLTKLGKGILYVSNCKIAQTINETLHDENYMFDDGSFPYSSGYLQSKVENKTSSTPNGEFNYDLTLGTFDTTVRFYFEYRTVAVTFDTLYVYRVYNNAQQIDELPGRVSHSTFEPVFTYNFETDTASLTGDMVGLSIHSQYYLIDWYLKNGNVITGCENFADFKTNSTIIDDIISVGADNARTNASNFGYNRTQPLAQQRVVRVEYAPGDAGEGRFYLSDKTTVVNEDYRVPAGQVTYGTKLSLDNTTYYNLGYTFSYWTATYGTFDVYGQYFCQDANWFNVFRTANDGTTIEIDSEGKQIWTSFSNSNIVKLGFEEGVKILEEAETRKVTLSANWLLIEYAILFDVNDKGVAYGRSSVNIGDIISYSTYADDKDGRAYYSITGSNLGPRAVDGRLKNGYVVTGYNLAQEGGAEGGVNNMGEVGKVNGNGTYRLTPDNFLAFINTDYRFVANSEGNPFVITTLRDPAKYIIYLSNSANSYFSYGYNTENIDTYGGFKDGQLFINVTFDAPVDNLVNAIADKTITTSREGYVLSGWARADKDGVQTAEFDPSKPYTITQDIFVVPTWTLTNNTVSSEISFADDVGEIREFYLTNSHDVVVGSFSGNNVKEGDKVTNASLVLKNGEKVDEYGYIVLIGGKTTTYQNEEKLNINKFNISGEVKVKFYVAIKDTLNKFAENKYTVESEEITFTMVKNTIYFYDYDLHSIYNGTNEFVPAKEGDKGVDNEFGKFVYRYDWNGFDRASESEIVPKGQTEKYFTDFAILGEDFTAGAGKSLKMGLNLNVFGNQEWNEIFDNVQKDASGYYVVISPNEVDANGLTIDKAKITITFVSGSALYIEDVQTTVYENSTPSQFTVGKVIFTYNYNCIKLVYGTPAGTYTGTRIHSEDSKYFIVEGLIVEGHSQESLAQNFEWNISESSKFTLVSSEDALKFQYLTRYLIAEDGQYKNSLSEIYDGLTDKLVVSSIKVGENSLKLSDKPQYSVFYGNQVIMSIAGNGSAHLFLYLNKDILSSYSVTFTISVSYLEGREAILYPLAWGNSTMASAYVNAFDSPVEGSANFTVNASVGLNNVSTYAVLTDAVKVNIDYNGGKVDENGGKTLFLANGDWDIENPVHEYAGLEFAGYTNESDNISIDYQVDKSIWTVSKGGRTQNFKAKWNFKEITAQLQTDTLERYANENGFNLKVDDIAVLTNLELFSSKIYTLSCGSQAYSFNSATSEFEIKNANGFALPSMSGEYTLTIDYTYTDGITSIQRQTKTLTFTLNILINEIEVGIDEKIVYANANKASSTLIDFALNGQADGSTSISELSKMDNRSAKHAVFISGSPSLILKDVGDYVVTFTVVSAYSEIYQFVNGEKTTTLTLTVEKYEIVLANYQDQINPSKIFGHIEPTITSTIKVNNEDVKIAFTREAGEGIGEYQLYFSQITSDNAKNYTVNTDGFEGKFKIVVPSGNLKVEFDNPLTYDYNGYALSEFESTFNGSNYTLTAKAGEDVVSTTYDLYYEYNGRRVEIPADEKDAFALVIEFSTLAGVDAGSYNLLASLTEAGASWSGVDIVNKDANIVINRRTITVTALEKVFDQTVSFVYNNKNAENNTATLTINNIPSYADGTQDEIVIAGTISSEFVGEVEITDIAISNGASLNYQIVMSESVDAKVVADAESEIVASLVEGATFSYGLFNKNLSASQISALIPLEYNSGDINSQYVLVKNAVVNGATYSKGGYLNAGTYEFELILASTNFTFTEARENSLTHEYTMSANVEITIDPIALTITNSTLKISKVYDGSDILPAKFVSQKVNQAGGYYSSVNMLEGDEIVIESARFADNNIGANKNIILEYESGDDSANYEITTTVVGEIVKINLKFVKNADTFEFVDGDKEFGNTGDIRIDFAGDIDALIDGLLEEKNFVTRIGYKQVGWAYNGVSIAEMTAEEKATLLENAVANVDGGLNLDVIWEIGKFKVSIKGDNAVASITEGEYQYYSDISNITVEANEGYVFAGVSANNENATLSVVGSVGKKTGKFSLTQLLGDIEITLLTKEIEVIIIIEYNTPSGVSVSTSDENWGNLREKTFGYSTLSTIDLPSLVVDKEGTYTFSHWTCDGQISEGENIWARIKGQSLTRNPAGAYIFVANWTEAELLLTINSSDHAQISVKVDGAVVNEGEHGFIVHYLDDIEISINHDAWYKWSGLEIDGKYSHINGDGSATSSKTGAFTIEKIASNIELTVQTEAIKVTFNTSYGALLGATIAEANGSIIGIYQADAGATKMSDIVATYTPSVGTYQQTGWTSGTNEISFNDNPQNVITLLNGSVPTSDLTLSLEAVFEGLAYTVTFVKGSEPGALFVGSDAGKTSATRTYVYGQALTNLPVLENDGKNYIWRTDANERLSEGKAFTTSLANASKTLTVTADWDFNLFNVYVNVTENADKVVSMSAGGVAFDDYIEVNLGGSQTIILTLEKGYEIDESNTVIASGSADTTISVNGNEIIIANVRAQTTINVVVKVQSYLISLNTTGYESFSIESFDVEYKQNLATMFAGQTFVRNGYVLKGFNVNGEKFASLSNGTWTIEETFAENNQYTYAQDLTLDADWEFDANANFITSSISKTGRAIYNGQAQVLATASIVVGSGEKFTEGVAFKNGDKVKDVYYLVDGQRVEAGANYAFVYKNYLSEASVYMVAVIEDVLSGQTHNVLSNEISVTLSKTQVYIKKANLNVYYTGTANANELLDGKSQGEICYSDNTANTELEIVKVEIIDATAKYSVGKNYQVKYFFNNGAGFNEENYEGLAREGGYYTVVTPMMGGTKVYAEISPAIVTINVSGFGFENGKVHKVTDATASVENFVKDAIVKLNSVVTRYRSADTYDSTSDFVIDYTVHNSAGEDISSNFTYALSGYYIIRSSTYAYQVNVESKYLTPEAMQETDCIVSVVSVEHAGKVVAIEEELNYVYNRELIFSISSNGSEDLTILVANGKSIKINLIISGSLAVAGWINSSELEDGLTLLQTLEEKESREKSISVNSQTTVCAVVTDYKAVMLDLGDKGGNDGFVYIKLGNTYALPVPQNWTGFNFAGWYSEDDDISINAKNATLSASADITVSYVKAIWVLAKPYATPKTFEFDAKLDGAMVEVGLSDIFVNGIENLNEDEITYTYEFFRDSNSISKEKTFEIAGVRSSSGSYTLKVTASKEGYGTLSETFNFNIQVNGLKALEIVLSGTTFEYQNVNYMSQVSANIVGVSSEQILLENLTQSVSPYCYFTFNGSEIKNAGKYDLTFVFDEDVFDIDSMADDFDYSHQITITKANLVVTAEDIPVEKTEKLLGMDDPDFTITKVMFEGGNQESVQVTLSRVAGESQGEYAFTGITSTSENFNLSLATGIYFTIKQANGTLQVVIEEGLSAVYTGSAISITAEYDNQLGQWTMKMGESVSTLKLLYKSGEDYIELSGNLYVIALEGISFAMPSAINVEVYDAKDIEVSGEGNFATFEFVGEIEITTKAISLSNITKVFDRTDVIVATSDNLVGLVAGDTVTLSGKYKQVTVGKDIELTDLKLDGEDSANYHIAIDEFVGDITAKAVASASLEAKTTSFVYGQLGVATSLSEILALVEEITLTIDGVTTDLANEYVSITGVIVNPANLSGGGMLKTGEQNVTVLVASDNFTGLESGFSIALSIAQKELDLSSLSIVKDLDGTTSLPNEITSMVAPFFFTGDRVEVDMINSKFEDSVVGSDKKVTIVLKGQDSANYKVLDNIVGKINAFSLTLQVNATTEHLDLVTDGQFVNDGVSPVVVNESFKVGYPTDSAEEVLNGLTFPERTGYTAKGWKYYDGANYILLTSENILEFLENISNDPENTTNTQTIYVVWEIDYYSISVEGENIASYQLFADNFTGDNNDGYKVRYFSDIELDIVGERGYKVKSTLLANGKVANKDFSDVGNNKSTIKLEKVASEISLVVTMEEIEITFDIDFNLPEFTERTDTSNLSCKFGYAELANKGETDLSQLSVTEGTYYLEGFVYKDANLIGEKTLQQIVDELIINLETDKTINLSASWVGETYKVIFDANGGTVNSDFLEINAVYGSAITEEFPEVVFVGKQVAWTASDGLTYSAGDILKSVGENIDGVWTLTLVANWESGAYKLTVEIDDNIVVRVDGEEIESGKIFEFVYGIDQVVFQPQPEAGYSYQINQDKFKGNLTEEEGLITVKDLTADGSLIFEKICLDNTLSLTLANIQSFVVEIDGEEVEVAENIVAKTESEVVITFTVAPGYHFADENLLFTGNGRLDKVISEDKDTLTITWFDFVESASLEINPTASDNIITVADASEYIVSLTLNGQSVSVADGQFTIKTGQEVQVNAVLKYGYEGCEISTGETSFVKDESQQNQYNSVDKHFHYSAVLTGFTSNFSISFIATTRTFVFEILVQEGQEEFGEITAQSPQYVKFGENLSLAQQELRYDYGFESWVSFGQVLSLDADAEVVIDEQIKTVLDSVDNGEMIRVYATYVKRTLDVTFSAGANGGYDIMQNDEVIISVSSESTIVQEILLGQDLVLKINNFKGYEVDELILDGQSVSLEDYGWTMGGEYITIYQDIDNPIHNISVSFKAGARRVTVLAGTRVRYEEYLGTTAGGLIYATDSRVNKLDESVYLENNGKLIIGADYQLATWTDQRIFFLADPNPGFTVSVSCDSEEVVINQAEIEGRQFYSISGIKEDITITAIFIARENTVNIQFAIEGSTEEIYGGMISVDTSSNLVSASPNRGSNIEVAVVTGEKLKLEVFSSLAYSLLADEGGYLRYEIVYSKPGTSYENVKVGNVVEEDSRTIGYSYSSTMEIDCVTADATIFIYVEAQEYTLRFAISDTDYVVMPAKVKYGKWFHLASLSEEDIQKMFPTRDGYILAGYFTHPLGQGNQYIDENKQIKSAWFEDGFEYNGTEYVEEFGFDAETNTYTLYSCWIYKKASLEIQFAPPEVDDSNTTLNITDVITNMTMNSAWTDQSQRWYAEVAISASLTFRALDFNNYEFVCWKIAFEDGEPVERPANFTLSNLELGHYTITAVYNPCYRFIIESTSTGKAEGGKSEIIQDGRIVTGRSYDKEKIITLRATAIEGFTFNHWVNLETGEIYQGTKRSDNSWTYTFANLVSKPLQIKAVFTGKTVNVDFDATSGGKVHAIRYLSLNGKKIGYLEPFKACVGDEIEFSVRKTIGYGFEVVGAPFVEVYDPITEYYTFTYTLSVKDLIAVDKESYSLNILFNATKEILNLSFSFDVDDAVDGNEKAKAGTLVFENVFGDKINVKEGDNYQIEYGDVVSLIIEEDTNYRIAYIYLKNPATNDVTAWLLGNELVIDQNFIDAYYARNIKIEVYFQRLVWIMEEFRATSLVGQGTKENPYEIYSAEEFALVAYLVNNGIEENGIKYAQCHYVLKSDIDFQGKYWEPIGTEINPFNGSFKLGGYDIRNVTHYRAYSNPKTSFGGLFWHIGREAEVTQENNLIMIVALVIGASILLITVIVVFFHIRRKNSKSRLHKIANK